MWLSRQTVKNTAQPAIQKGRVTLNSNGQLEAVSTGAERSIRIYSPYGYKFSPPKGENMLLTQSDGEQASFGVEMSTQGIKPGEIKITSQFGGYIYLKNDGSVVINGLKINSKGEIENA